MPSEMKFRIFYYRIGHIMSYIYDKNCVTTKQILDVGRNVQVPGFPTKRSV